MRREFTDERGAEWYLNDTRGYLDAGPACDECGACECCTVAECAGDNRCASCKFALDAAESAGDKHKFDRVPCCHQHSDDPNMFNAECIGLAVAYVCLDGGDALCEACAEKAGIVA